MPDTSPKEKKKLASRMSTQAGRRAQRHTPKREESERASNVESGTVLTGCIAAVNKTLCDMPSVDLSHDRPAQTGKSPEDALKAGRELGLRNMLNFDAFELMEELPAGKHAYDMVWVDEWRGDRVRSRLCGRQFRAEGLRDDLVAGTPDTFFIIYLLARAGSCKDLGILVIDISVAFMHAPTDEEMSVTVPSDIKSSKILETHGSSERDQKSFKAPARVLM